MKLSAAKIGLFAAPAMPIAALGIPLVVYLPPFYAEDVGLGLSVVGAIFMAARFWDMLTDLLMGALSDRVRTRFGRRRPLLVLAVPVLVVCVWRVFVPPDGAGVVYLLGWLLALYVGWTLLSISHMAWAAELSTDYDMRTRLQAWREIALGAGMILVLLLPALIEQRVGGGGATRAAAMGWFIIAFLPVTVALAVWRVPEPPPEGTPDGGRSLLAAMKLAAANTAMLRVLAADLLAGIAPGVTAALYVFFIEHAMGLGRWTSLLLLTYFVAALVGVPLWLRVSYRLGKHRAFAVAMVYAGAVLPVVLLLDPGDLAAYAVINVIYGLGHGATPVLLRSITADITDDDQLRSGSQRTGLFYSLLTLTNKLGLALAVGIAYPLLELVGFDPAGANDPSAIAGLTGIYVFVPVACFALAAVVMWRFPLDRARQLALRRQLEGSTEPVGSAPLAAR